MEELPYPETNSANTTLCVRLCIPPGLLESQVSNINKGQDTGMEDCS